METSRIGTYAVKTMTDEPDREVMLNLKVRFLLREEFKVAADFEGLDMSNMIRHFMIRTIREVRERNLEIYEKALQSHLSNIGEKKKSSQPQAEETTRKATSGLVAVPPATNAALAVDLTRRTGVKIEPYQVALYRISLENKCDEYHELSDEIKEVIAAHFEGTLKDYLSKREKTG
jgi:hypothetical protein